MKRFIQHFGIWILSAIIVLSIYPLYLYNTGKFKKKVIDGGVYLSLEKSKKRGKYKKLIIGDSVAKQLFDNGVNDDSILSLACNQAISLAGQFILVKNFFGAGNIVDTVYLVYSPTSFKNNLTQIYTFNYFLKPFYPYYKDQINSFALNQIKKNPLYFLSVLPQVKTSNWAPEFSKYDVTLILNYPLDTTFVSDISYQYLDSLHSICREYGAHFEVLPTPVPKSKEKIIVDWKNNYLIKNNWQPQLSRYFDRVKYLNDTLFMPDGNHFIVAIEKEFDKYPFQMKLSFLGQGVIHHLL